METHNQLVTYTMAIRVDSPQRLANIQTGIRFLVENLDARIFILKADSEPKFWVDKI